MITFTKVQQKSEIEKSTAIELKYRWFGQKVETGKSQVKLLKSQVKPERRCQSVT